MKKYFLIYLTFLTLNAQNPEDSEIQAISIEEKKIEKNIRLENKINPPKIFDNQALEAQKSYDFHQIVRFVPGMYAFATYGGTRATVGARGYRDITYLRDGIALNLAVQEMQNVENIFFLKGASALEFGRISPGGMYFVNSKKAFLKERQIVFGSDIQLINNYGIRPFFDVNLPLNATTAFRLNGLYHKTENEKNLVGGQRFLIAPSFVFTPSENTQITLNYEFLQDSVRPENGGFVYFKNFNEKPQLIYDRKKYLGFESDFSKLQEHMIMLQLEQKIDRHWNLFVQTNFSSEKRNTFLPSTNRLTIPIKENQNTIGFLPTWIRQLTQSDSDIQNYYNQIDLVGKGFKTQSFEHDFRIGLDGNYQQNIAQSYYNKTIDSINILQNTLIDGTEISNAAQEKNLKKNTKTIKNTLRLGANAQYRLQWKNYLRITGGARFTFEQLSSNKENPNQGWTPFAGIEVFPAKNTQLFATYTNTFVPSTLKDQKTEKLLGNDYHQQWEIGGNWFYKNFIKIQLTFYHIFVQNQIVPLLDENGISSTIYGEKTGSLRNQGIEIEIESKPVEGLGLNAGYSLIDAHYLRSEKFVDNAIPFNTPKHSFFVWADYDFEKWVKGLKIGIGGNFVGKREGNDQVKIPYHNILPQMPNWQYDPYFQLDARISYSYKKSQFQLNANNLTNAQSWVSYRTEYVNPIQPFYLIFSFKQKI